MSFLEEFERTLAAAQAGDAQAQFDAGRALLRGSVVPRDLEAGRAWLERAIDQGQLDALHALAQHDLFAGKLGRGAQSAWSLLQRGAALGDGRAQLQVARAIAHGLSIEQASDAEAYFERTGLPADSALALELANAARASHAEDAQALIDELLS